MTSTPSFDFSHVRSVGVLGAGVAGLQVAEQMKEVGIECVLFEKEDDVGGVWRKNYADFGLQVPKELYEFPSYPFPAVHGSFPKGPEVQEYIKKFAQEKGIYNSIKFNTKVVGMVPLEQKPGWQVSFQTEGEAVEEQCFDFVVVATGMYGTPFTPTYPDADLFEGEIMHAASFQDKEIAAGKKVIVVGGGKSAIDCAVAASEVAESATLLFREVHWPVPRHLLNLVPFKWGTYSRFGHATLPTYYDASSTERALHAAAKPLKWAWWRTVELMFRAQFRLSGDFVPDSRIEHDLFNGGQILSYDFRDKVRSKQLDAVKGTIARFTKSGVVLCDGTEIQADVIVFGTGFKKEYAYLDAQMQQRLGRENDGLWLYRNIFPTNVENLCFIGSEVSTFNNILTQGIQALWLQRVLSGACSLPAREVMEEDIKQQQEWKRSWMPEKGDRAAILQLHKLKYHDQLCKDMKVEHKRKGWNFLGECFAPYLAADYRSLFGLKRVAQGAPTLLGASANVDDFKQK